MTGGTVSENIEGVMNAAMKRSSKKRKTASLLKSIKDGEIYGDDGAGALECMFVTIGKENFQLGRY